jgi:hypothetical protein
MSVVDWHNATDPQIIAQGAFWGFAAATTRTDSCRYASSGFTRVQQEVSTA